MWKNIYIYTLSINSTFDAFIIRWYIILGQVYFLLNVIHQYNLKTRLHLITFAIICECFVIVMKCGPTVKSVINKHNSIAKERIIDPITFYYCVGPRPFFTNFSLRFPFITFPCEIKQHQWIFYYDCINV